MDWIAISARAAERRSGATSWIWAAAIATAAICLRIAFASWLEPTRFITYFVAIGATAFLFGWRQATMVLVLSLAAVRYLSMAHQPEGLPSHAHVAATLIICLVAGGLEIAVVSGLRDLTVRLSRMNKAQETLFNELQHRIANNMQIIASMLHTTKGRVSDPIGLEVIDQAAARIDSLARLHRQLYSPSTYRNGLEPVLRDVLDENFHGLPVNVELEVKTSNLSIDQMTAIVFLVNEAAVNAAKHVFRPVQGTLFAVALLEPRTGILLLTITDDGPGIKPVPQPSRQTKTLGMNIMWAFAQQLGGQLEIKSGMPGTTLTVEFARA